MRRLAGLLAALIAGTATLAGAPAYAKKVSVEWKPIPGAVSYELQVRRNGKTVESKISDDPSWSGNLGFGAYSYQIRAIDKVKRPGLWSEPRALVVAPKPPELEAPVSGRKVTLYDPKAGITLKWEAVEGVSKYAVTVKRGGRVFYQGNVAGTTLALKELAAGGYSWQVAAVIEASDRAPSSLRGKSWRSPSSDVEEFEIDHQQLAKVVQVYPNGVIPPGKDGRIQFEWKKVDGAEAYEVEVQVVDSRVPAAVAAAKSKKFRATGSSLVLSVPGEGVRQWKVRALANLDANKVAEAVGPESVMQFQVSRSADFFEGSGYIALSSLLSPYTFATILPDHSLTANPVAVTFRLSGEYWFSPSWGVGAGAENTQFTLSHQDHSSQTFELNLRYREKISKDKFAWFFAPKIGVELRDNFQLHCGGGNCPRITSPYTDKFSSLGASVGFDLRKQINEKLSLGVKVAYFYPLSISNATTDDPGISGATSDGSSKIQLALDRSRVENLRNLNIGIQGLYWLAPRLGIGAGIFGEMRSAAYKLENIRDTDQARVRTDALHLFTSLLYTFGK